jgi:hypothetical protein
MSGLQQGALQIKGLCCARQSRAEGQYVPGSRDRSDSDLSEQIASTNNKSGTLSTPCWENPPSSGAFVTPPRQSPRIPTRPGALAPLAGATLDQQMQRLGQVPPALRKNHGKRGRVCEPYIQGHPRRTKESRANRVDRAIQHMLFVTEAIQVRTVPSGTCSRSFVFWFCSPGQGCGSDRSGHVQACTVAELQPTRAESDAPSSKLMAQGRAALRQYARYGSTADVGPTWDALQAAVLTAEAVSNTHCDWELQMQCHAAVLTWIWESRVSRGRGGQRSGRGERPSLKGLFCTVLPT